MKAPVSSVKRIALLAGPIVACALIFFYHPDIKHPEIGYTLAIAAWMAIWWITEMILPVLSGMAIATHTHPLLFMLTGTLAASMGFMLPAATPPNAIIFGTRRITIWEMVRTGFWLDLIGAVIITGVIYFIGSAVFKINPGEFPAWAVPVVK